MKMFGVPRDKFVDAGGTIGEMAVLGQAPGHPTTAIAETYLWVRRLDKKLLDRAIKAYPGDEHRMTVTTAGLFD